MFSYDSFFGYLVRMKHSQSDSAANIVQSYRVALLLFNFVSVEERASLSELYNPAQGAPATVRRLFNLFRQGFEDHPSRKDSEAVSLDDKSRALFSLSHLQLGACVSELVSRAEHLLQTRAERQSQSDYLLVYGKATIGFFVFSLNNIAFDIVYVH